MDRGDSGNDAPRGRAPDERPARPRDAGDASPGEARRVLLIDDERAIRLALGRYFGRRGWMVDDVPDAESALVLLRTAPPAAFDAILLDLTLPGLSGSALHDLIRDERPDLFRRLIISSGDLTSPMATELRARSPCPFIQKPFDFDTLARVVDSVGGR